MDDLKIEVLKEGEGAVAEAGDIVSVHYTGWLTDGTKFDSSVDRGEPIEYPCGVGMVIPGWEKAVVGMKVGQKCRVTIPPHLGYGALRRRRRHPAQRHARLRDGAGRRQEAVTSPTRRVESMK